MKQLQIYQRLHSYRTLHDILFSANCDDFFRVSFVFLFRNFMWEIYESYMNHLQGTLHESISKVAADFRYTYLSKIDLTGQSRHEAIDDWELYNVPNYIYEVSILYWINRPVYIILLHNLHCYANFSLYWCSNKKLLKVTLRFSCYILHYNIVLNNGEFIFSYYCIISISLFYVINMSAI